MACPSDPRSLHSKKKERDKDVSVAAVWVLAMDGLTLLQVLGGCVDELQGDKLEAALLKAGNDVSDETALDAVGLSYAMLSSSTQCTSKKKKQKMGDQGNGTHLDHDVRTLINGRHVRYGFLWVM
jgi:hypothetical protein